MREEYLSTQLNGRLVVGIVSSKFLKERTLNEIPALTRKCFSEWMSNFNQKKQYVGKSFHFSN